MHRSNDPDDRFRARPDDDDGAPLPPSSNAIPLAALVLALLGIPAARALDWLYRLATDSPTLITRDPPLLAIPALAMLLAVGCLFRKRYRRSQAMMVLIFAIFIASFWLGLGLFVYHFPPRAIQ